MPTPRAIYQWYSNLPGILIQVWEWPNRLDLKLVNEDTNEAIQVATSGNRLDELEGHFEDDDRGEQALMEVVEGGDHDEDAWEEAGDRWGADDEYWDYGTVYARKRDRDRSD